MARIHGRRGTVYAEITSGSSPVAVAFLKSWSVSLATDKVENTAFGDTNKTYQSGLPDASGDFTGFYDESTEQFYSNAVNGFTGKLYIYPNSATATRYFVGSVLVDQSYSAAVDGNVEISASWVAAGPFWKQG